ncbi:hypothetical protein AFLA_007288 [Aspergillus flavus NRRL3357]|nr:hypothetical protein AFLA_007288 [Aspergillus flavus NRRL3357]
MLSKESSPSFDKAIPRSRVVQSYSRPLLPTVIESRLDSSSYLMSFSIVPGWTSSGHVFIVTEGERGRIVGFPIPTNDRICLARSNLGV